MSKSKKNPHSLIIVTSTLMLSVCASVFTFLLLTRAEEWWRNRQAESPDAYIYDEYDPEPAAIIIETYAEESAGGIVSDEPTPAAAPLLPPESPRASQTSESTRRSVERYHAPPVGPSAPFMIDNAPPVAPLFALTFDGGSFANIAGEILDTLASRGVRSTMFVTGEFIRKFPGVVSRIAAEGHELGNHTRGHPRLTTFADDRTQATRPGVNRGTVESELEGAARILADRTGLRFAPLWRAPYGEYNRQICGWALEAGYVHIGWRHGRSWYQNLDTNDWVPDETSSAFRSPREVFDKITSIAAQPNGLNGGIILMHLGTERKNRSQQVHTILGRLIDTLRSMGYEPVTVSEMLFRTGINVNDLALGISD